MSDRENPPKNRRGRPKKRIPTWIRKIVVLEYLTTGCGVKRLKEYLEERYGIDLTTYAIWKILHEEGVVRSRKRKRISCVTNAKIWYLFHVYVYIPQQLHVFSMHEWECDRIYVVGYMLTREKRIEYILLFLQYVLHNFSPPTLCVLPRYPPFYSVRGVEGKVHRFVRSFGVEVAYMTNVDEVPRIRDFKRLLRRFLRKGRINKFELEMILNSL